MASPLDEVAEEYAIHDYEGFGAYEVGEYEGLESVHKVACFLEEHGAVAGDVLAHFGDNIEDARKALEENYNGCYSSLADYAEELTTETSEVPEHLAFYIDYERMGRDMEMSGDIFTVETGYQRSTRILGALREDEKMENKDVFNITWQESDIEACF